MNRIDIVFDEISEIERVPNMGISAPKRTTFNFKKGNQREYGVMVLGWPDIKPGIGYSCLLRDANNWQTLVAWKNRESGEIAGPTPTYFFYLIGVTCFITLLCGFATDFNIETWMASSVPLQLFLLLPLLFGLAGIGAWLKYRRILIILKNL